MLRKLEIPIPLETYKGRAWAVAVIDYGANCELEWVTFLHGTGEKWTFNSNEIERANLLH